MLSDPQEQEVVLIGHSMGTQLAVRLAHHLAHRMSSAPAAENFIMSESDSGPKSLVCVGLVAICPPAHVDPKIEALKQKLYYLPPLIFDVFRSFDRVGGLDSKSVTRLVDPKASEEVRSQQLRINLQVNTKAWIRTAYGFETVGSKEWASLQCPIYLIGAHQDHVIPCDHVLEIHSWFDKSSVSASIQPVIVNDAGHSCMIEKYQLLCGLVGDFVSKKVDSHLSLAWQLAFLASQSDKWSLKNEQKWRSVQPVGDRVMIPGDNVSVVSTPYSNSSVIDTRVRGMKTLRENDSSHSPQLVEQQYPDIYHIVDISRDQPPYDPSTFKRIKYHKFPTVSKVPPSRKEVKQFNELVDDCLAKTPHNGCLAVHCHYGFNRTGFFICAYLIERYNATVTVAVEAFKRSRSPGIKHPHFVDELYVRYELGGNNRRVSTSL